MYLENHFCNKNVNDKFRVGVYKTDSNDIYVCSHFSSLGIILYTIIL